VALIDNAPWNKNCSMTICARKCLGDRRGLYDIDTLPLKNID
jgi:hypothetical protein